jgi:hypothetical protein
MTGATRPNQILVVMAIADDERRQNRSGSVLIR